MPNAIEFMKIVKRAALEAVEASNPVHVCFGMVMKENPLEIFVDQKMTLKEAQLVLTRNVTDFEMDVEADWISGSGNDVVSYATSFVGKIPYLFGAGREYGTLEEIVAVGGMADCSAFTERVFRHFGAEIGSTTYTQMYAGTEIGSADMAAGDLLLFNNHSSGAQPGHVGIYIGDGQVVHEGGGNYTGNVKISPLSSFDVMYIRRITVSGETDGERKSTKLTVCNGLTVGDKVVLVRQQGGQKYIVVDRIV